MKLMRLRISRKHVYCIIAVAFLLDCALAGPNDPPRLSPPVIKNGKIQLFIFNGRWGQTNIVEMSTDLARWTPVSTNVFPATLCPMCPFIIFQDSLTNSAQRFYRARNL
jgi:hypothetical protein